MQKISKKSLHVFIVIMLTLVILVGIQLIFAAFFDEDMKVIDQGVSIYQSDMSTDVLATPDVYLNAQYRIDITPAQNKIKFDRWNGIQFNPLFATQTAIHINSSQLPEENWYGYEQDPDPDMQDTWFTLRVSSTSPLYFVRYDAGPSGDPTYQYYIREKITNGDTRYVYKGATPIGLLVPGEGILYTDSWINEFYPAKRSFVIGPENRIVEIKRKLTLIDQKTTVQSKGVYLLTHDSPNPVELKLGELVYIKGIDEEKERYIIQIQRGGSQIEGWVLRDSINDTEQCSIDDSTSEIFSSKTTFRHLCFLGD